MATTMAKEPQRPIQGTKQQDAPTHREDPILTPGEVAAIFGINAQTVRNWIHAKAIACIRMPGGRFGVRKSAVNAILVETGIKE